MLSLVSAELTLFLLAALPLLTWPSASELEALASFVVLLRSSLDESVLFHLFASFFSSLFQITQLTRQAVFLYTLCVSQFVNSAIKY